MTDVQTLLDLPLETIATLGSGYVGYRLAYIGQDHKHRAVDVAFLSLAFGLITKLLISVFENYTGSLNTSILTSILCVLVCAALWRKYISGWIKSFLRYLSISYSDGNLTAWDTIRVGTEHKPTQITVRKKDGSQLMCDYLHYFEHFPHGPCQYGEDGSIALYITHHLKNSDEEWEKIDLEDSDFGTAMTYIPASQIDEIELRQLP